MLGLFLPRYFTHFFPHPKLALALIGVTLAGVRTIDTLGVDLPIGWAMDKFTTRFGRYRPWYVAGAPFVMIGAYMLFNPPRGMSTTYLGGWYLFMYIGLSMMTIASSAWATPVSPEATTSVRGSSPGRFPGRHHRVGLAGAVAHSVTKGKFGPRAIRRRARSSAGSSIGLLASDHVDPSRCSSKEPEGCQIQRAQGGLIDYWRIIANPHRAAAGAGRPLPHPRPRAHGSDLSVFLQSIEGLHHRRGHDPAVLLHGGRSGLGACFGAE